MKQHSTIPRESTMWIAIGALLCVVECSRTSQSTVPQSGTPQALEAIVRDFAEQHRLPGLAAGVWRRGEIILRMGIGHQDGPGSPPIDGETVFHLASVSKPFVATAVMRLVEEGKMFLPIEHGRQLVYHSGSDRSSLAARWLAREIRTARPCLAVRTERSTV